jgi:hypothetical protein
MSEERKHVWVDLFQTRLVTRIGAYLVVFFIVFLNLLFAWKMIEEGPVDPARQFYEMVRNYFPVMICLVVLIPVMAWDTIRFSHRLVGPLVRFRKTMRAIADGEAVRPIKLREGDYLTELRDDFNKMLQELQRRGIEVIMPADPADEQDAKKRTA